jgi:hypothetical protein
MATAGTAGKNASADLPLNLAGLFFVYLTTIIIIIIIII